MTWSEIIDIESAEDLRPEWDQLWQESPAATPFQTSAWLLGWWKLFGVGELHLLQFRRQEKLVGMVPLFVQTDPRSRLRSAFLVGSGTSDYLDVLLHPGEDRLVAGKVICDCLDDLHCERCEFHSLPAGSLLGELPDSFRWSTKTLVQDVCPVLNLPDRLEELADGVANGFWKQLAYCQRKAQRLGLTFSRVRADEVESFFDHLRVFVEGRCQNKCLLSALRYDPQLDFHRNVAPQMSELGILRLYALRLGTRTVAVYYGFFRGERAYYYLGGYDPEFKSLSPGNLLVHHAISQAMEEGATVFDFLRGDESYKYRWGAIDQPVFGRVLKRRM